MKAPVPLGLLLVSVAITCACGKAPADTAWRVTALDGPAGSSSALPQLSVSGDRATLSWVERTGQTATLKFAERGAAGWSAAQTVASGDDWFVNWADVPSVTRLADGSLAAHWLQKSGPGTYAYDVRVSFSGDDGRTWSPSVTPHHDGTQTEHGFASLFQAPGAGLGVIWLDGRAMAGEHHDGAGAMSLRAATFAPDGQQLSETILDERVCECCPTAVAVTTDGPLAAFRNRSDEEVRDIYVTRLVNGHWTTPAAVHHDRWQIQACPVNGPALAARDRQVVIAWFTIAGEEGRVFAAFSNDAGATFGQPVRMDEGRTIGRVDVDLLEDGSAVVSWIELLSDGAEFRLRRVSLSGERDPSVSVARVGLDRSSGYPRMARHGGELLMAWTEAGTAPQVRTAVIDLLR
jgi:hypothetical protein